MWRAERSGDSFFFRFTHRRGVSCNKGAVPISSDLRITRLEYSQQMVRLFPPAFSFVKKKTFSCLKKIEKRGNHIDLFSLKMRVRVKRSRLPQWRRSKRNLLMNKAARRTSESQTKVSHPEVSQEGFSLLYLYIYINKSVLTKREFLSFFSFFFSIFFNQIGI